MSVRYVVVTAHAWANETGYGTEHRIPSRNAWSSIDAAISEGFEICGTDDFNIAKINNGKVVALQWMNEDINEDAATLEKLTKLTKGIAA